jgi:hypothetical protein
MKIRNLKRKSGQAVYSVWPSLWAGSYAARDKFPIGEVYHGTGAIVATGPHSGDPCW